MCGVLGYLSYRTGPLPVDLLCRLTNLLRHRGPDAGGYWTEGPVFLGHRRLSIIGLSRGAQPMASVDGRYLVSFNGEIYNYVELRQALVSLGHRFRTDSDTEVLLAGYSEWGVALASHLVGMFAFGLFDREQRTLYLARDRMGEKPLLIHESSAAVMFASELGPLASFMPNRELDPKALASYLCLNYVRGERTMMRGVCRLGAGAWRLYGESGLLAGEQYWRPPEPSAVGDLSVRESADELQKRLDEAITITLRSDVPVGLFLSGGIDSSVVAESASRLGKLSMAFCLDMGAGFSEWKAAAAVAAKLGLKLHRVGFSSEVLNNFVDIVGHADDPLADSSALPVWVISAAAAEHVKVVLSGDGGDELFAGYLTYKASRMHGGLVSRLPGWVRAGLAGLSRRIPVNDQRKVSRSYKVYRFLRAATLPTSEAHFTWNGTWLPQEAARLLGDPENATLARDALTEMARAHGLPHNPTLHELQCADIGDYLANDILCKVDRMGMAHGLELRSPLLNPGVVDFALSRPLSQRMSRHGGTKRLLRCLCRRHFGPSVADAAKQGFSIPIHEWLRGPARGLMEDLLSPGAIDAIGVLDLRTVRLAREAHLSGRRALGWELWGLMVLSAWHASRVASPLSGSALPDAGDLVPVAVDTPING